MGTLSQVRQAWNAGNGVQAPANAEERSPVLSQVLPHLGHVPVALSG